MSARLEYPAEAVALLTLARPPVNALDADVMHAVADLLDELAASADVRAVVVTGDGDRAFSAGADTRILDSAAAYGKVVTAGPRMFRSLNTLPIPIVGAINGPAIGAGAVIAAESDVLVATPTAYFSVPEVAIGVIGGGSGIKRLAPYFKTQRMLLLAEKLTAEEGLAFGTVARIVERDALVDAALDIAAALAKLDPRVVRDARKIFRAPERDAAYAGYLAEIEAGAAIVAERAVD